MVTTRTSFGAPARPVPIDAPEDVTRVTLLFRISGTRNGVEWPPVGEDIVVPAAEAADLIRNQLARPALEPVERAVVEPPVERAVVSRTTKRRS